MTVKLPRRRYSASISPNAPKASMSRFFDWLIRLFDVMLESIFAPPKTIVIRLLQRILCHTGANHACHQIRRSSIMLSQIANYYPRYH